MMTIELCSDSDLDVSVDSDYNSSGGSDHSSPVPAASTLVPQQPAYVLYYVVVPPGYHLEFTSVEPSFTEPSPVKFSTKKLTSNELRFTKTFQRRLIKWSLPPPLVHPANLPGWSATPYGPLAVHFQCPVAKHPGWTSKKGLVNFWFRMRRQGEETVCEVLFKPYGQQCRKCNKGTLSQQSSFLPALWYPEFVEVAVRSLSILIGQLYYGSSQTSEERFWCADPSFLRKNRQSTKSSRMPHDSSRCQACIESLSVMNNSAMISSV